MTASQTSADQIQAMVKTRLGEERACVEAYLSTCLGTLGAVPEGLVRAMNYSLLAGGKRIRPVLCLSFARLFGADPKDVMPFAAAIECIHSYSLIHDDLPAMDNDDTRRGKPSNHKQFDEASAILAGDALLTDAFWFMASVSGALPAQRVLAAIACMARAAGSPGMVGGQFLDMQFTGKSGLGLDDLRAVHAMKTGALLEAACASGALLAGASPADYARTVAYGRALGAAFQIMDDVLDETGDSETMGKAAGSDAARGKVTYPSLMGAQKSLALARQESDRAIAALAEYADRAEVAFLSGLAWYVVNRVN